MPHVTSPSGLHYDLTHNPTHLTAHSPATLTLTIYNPTPQPIPLPPLTLTLPTTPHPHDTTVLTTTPETVQVKTSHDITVTRPNPATHTLHLRDSTTSITLTPRQSFSIQLTELATADPGTATLLLAETADPTPDAYHQIRTATWPSGTIVKDLTVTNNPLSGTEPAELTWKYLASFDNRTIDYKLTYYPQPDDEEHPIITVPSGELLKYSGPKGDDGLTPIRYKTSVFPTASPTPFVLSASLDEGGDTRNYWTTATVSSPHVHAYNIQAATTHLFNAPRAIDTNLYHIANTDGFLIAIPSLEGNWNENAVTEILITEPEAREPKKYSLKRIDRPGSVTIPVSAGSGCLVQGTYAGYTAGYDVTWQSFGTGGL